MKKSIIFLIIIHLGFQLFAQDVEKSIVGVITDDEQPLENVNIYIKGESTGVLSNSKGEYSILAKKGKILVFSFVGFQTQEFKVRKNTDVLNIQLVPKVEELDEVVLKKKRAFAQKEMLAEYPRNKKLIKTYTGIIDKDRASHSMQIIDGQDLIPVGPDFLTSLQNLVPRMIVDRATDPDHIIAAPRVYLQRWVVNSTALFDVDGVLYHQTPTFVDVHDIERISILVRNGAIARYGSEAVGGVIIINTKSNTWMDDTAIKRTYDNSNLRDSINRVLNLQEINTFSVPKYIQDYIPLNSEEEAFQFFEKQRLMYTDSAYYFIDVFDHFMAKWNNKKMAGKILDEVQLDSLSNIPTLKALAFKHEELGEYRKALDIYLKIKKLKPANAQSHRDVANSYLQIEDFKKALNVYARYKIAVDEVSKRDYGENETEVIIDTELNNLLELKGKELSIDAPFSKNKKDRATRVVLEWSNTETEFDLQFVNPNQKYNSWKKSIDIEANSIKKHLGSKQFFLDNSVKGKWQVKINNHKNDFEAPTYIKITTYFDYGTSAQSKQIKVFKFNPKDIGNAILNIDTELKHIQKQDI